MCRTVLLIVVLGLGGGFLQAPLLAQQVFQKGPLTRFPYRSEAFIKASNTEAEDRFGFSVAISGDTLVFGAPYEDSSATGVNGDDSDNTSPNSGAAFVFVRSGSTWTQQAYLKASNAEAGDFFGWSVDVSGDTIVVGAFSEDSSDVGVNGPGIDNVAFGSGAAYVFVRHGSVWSQEAYLKASNTDIADAFGISVGISGETIVVGASGEDSSAAGVNGDQTDNAAGTSGAAYVFVRSGSTWTQEAYLKASNPDSLDGLGTVAICGNTIVAGAPGEDSATVGVNGDGSDNGARGSGAAYVFVRDGTTWTQQAYLKAPNTEEDDFFGSAVDVSGDTVVVGAPTESGGSPGVNGDPHNNNAYASGAAYVFDRDGANWSQAAYVKSTLPDSFDRFGDAVSISGPTIIVGAFEEDGGSSGVDGDPSDNSLSNSGAAFVLRRGGGVWQHEAYLKASFAEFGDVFGYSVAIDSGNIVLGAPSQSSSATGVNGLEEDGGAVFSGAGYLFVPN